MSSLTASQVPHFNNFNDFLAQNLRVGTKVRVYHVSTSPTPVTPIFAAPPGRLEEPTTCVSHFLAISQEHVTLPQNGEQSSGDQHDTAVSSKKAHVLVLGIEVLIFSTKSLTTVFVSKADSTGFLPRLKNTDQGSLSIIKAVISAVLEWLVSQELSTEVPDSNGVTEKSIDPPQAENNDNDVGQSGNSATTGEASRPKKKKIVLSLFARSQNQYLFPGSIENETKHVLGDRQLIKWWCRVLDTLVQKNWPERTPNDDHNVEKTFNVSSDMNDTSRDIQHYPLASVATIPNAYVIVPGCDRSETVRSFYPPSARHISASTRSRWHNSFPVDFLIGEDASTSSTTLPVRCMIPRLPDDPKARYCGDLDDIGTDDKGQWRDMRSLKQFWETMEYRQECSAGRVVGFVWVTFEAQQHLHYQSNKQDRIPDTSENSGGYIESTDVRLPPLTPVPQDTSQSDLAILTSEQYIELTDLLINNTDFAGLSTAAKSTNEWIAKVKELSGRTSFGVDVEGKLAVPATPQNGQTPLSTNNSTVESADTEPAINVLTAVRKKKRKAEEPDHTNDNGMNKRVTYPKDDGHKESSANTPEATESEPVKTLSAGLVRKKPKVKQ